ncbi:MAG TPA: RdgB/HAM1 family non-canonical purine NTP pyrophosphatase [Mariprofundaceae bacterium]|nr:RdgB/HAM1 family non-canonical purine NTP pyrophosphatase [Mariprofundaceae bacterium]
MKLVIASNNAKKRAEIEAILGGLSIEFVPAADTRFVDVVEDAGSFAGNARKKAEAFAAANGCAALADDSGLCVDALDGAPGVYSSRFAGVDATDADNNARLLQLLLQADNRRARFVCALNLALPDGRAVTAEGSVEGQILSSPAGNGGFGYDPLFYCPELGKAFAEATAAEKASVSHRGRALRELAAKLRSIGNHG